MINLKQLNQFLPYHHFKMGSLNQVKELLREKNFIVKLTAQKMKFSIKDFFSKCDQIRRKLRIWSHLLKKSLMENFIFYAVTGPPRYIFQYSQEKQEICFSSSFAFVSGWVQYRKFL